MFPIRESLKLQFRAEFFKLVETTVTLRWPGGQHLAGTVGQILSAGSPRILQFGLRLTFLRLPRAQWIAFGPFRHYHFENG